MLAVEREELLVFAACPPIARANGERAPVVSRHYSHYRSLIPGEARHLRVLYEVERMAMMIVVGDVVSDVMQDGSVLEQSRVCIAQAVNCPGPGEDFKRQPRHLMRMGGVIVIAPGHRQDGFCPH